MAGKSADYLVRVNPDLRSEDADETIRALAMIKGVLSVAEAKKDRTAKLAYSVDDFADSTGLSRSLLYEDIAAGALIARKKGARTIILADDGAAYLAELPIAVSARAKGGSPK